MGCQEKPAIEPVRVYFEEVLAEQEIIRDRLRSRKLANYRILIKDMCVVIFRIAVREAAKTEVNRKLIKDEIDKLNAEEEQMRSELIRHFAYTEEQVQQMRKDAEEDFFKYNPESRPVEAQLGVVVER